MVCCLDPPTAMLEVVIRADLNALFQSHHGLTWCGKMELGSYAAACWEENISDLDLVDPDSTLSFHG